MVICLNTLIIGMTLAFLDRCHEFDFTSKRLHSSDKLRIEAVTRRLGSPTSEPKWSLTAFKYQP